jgi:hypothetical protein
MRFHHPLSGDSGDMVLRILSSAMKRVSIRIYAINPLRDWHNDSVTLTHRALRCIIYKLIFELKVGSCIVGVVATMHRQLHATQEYIPRKGSCYYIVILYVYKISFMSEYFIIKRVVGKVEMVNLVIVFGGPVHCLS